MVARVVAAVLLTLAALSVTVPGTDRAGTALLGAAVAVLGLGARRVRHAQLEPELEADLHAVPADELAVQIADVYETLERLQAGRPRSA